MERDIEKDKPVDWLILVGSIVFILVGIGAPWIIVEYGDASPRDWGWDSWQLYVSILCFVVYFSIGKVLWDMRNDDEIE